MLNTSYLRSNAHVNVMKCFVTAKEIQEKRSECWNINAQVSLVGLTIEAACVHIYLCVKVWHSVSIRKNSLYCPAEK